MCIEYVTWHRGEMLIAALVNLCDVALRCCHTTVRFDQCDRARSLFSRYDKTIENGRCVSIERSVRKIDSLCPRCQAQADDDPFYLIHMGQTRTPSMTGSPPTSPFPFRARATTMPSQNPQFLPPAATTRPSTAFQRAATAAVQPQSAGQQRPQHAGRSLSFGGGLRRLRGFRRPSSRSQAHSTLAGLQHSATDRPSGSSYFD